MKLNEDSIRWAINHILKFHDTDLFPLPKEFEVIGINVEDFISIIKNIDLSSYQWNSSRRFIIPKSELSYRVVTQLTPIDSIIFSALIVEIGSKIELKRIPFNRKRVFTYRFNPTSNGDLYRANTPWTSYWSTALEKIETHQFVTYLDIADFYNQIYHHTIENQLISCGVENQKIKVIMNLLNSLTQRVSRGIPVGPFAAHLLAEMSLIPIDNLLGLKGYDFVRYADDYLIFTNTKEKAKAAVYELAGILDKEQRLNIQTQKTKIFSKSEFIEYAKAKLADQPLNEQEKEILELIKDKTGNDPYAQVSIYTLSADELAKVSEGNLVSLLESYLQEEHIDYVRIRWIYRRLSQLGAPGLVNFSIENFDELFPAINDVCHYLLSASETYSGDWKELGELTLELLNLDIVKSNEYFQIALINLFSSNEKMNHFDKLLELYKNSSEPIKRKIILMANQIGAESWIRHLKESVGQMNDWTKRAYFMSLQHLPNEEKKFLIRGIKTSLSNESYLELFLLKKA